MTTVAILRTMTSRCARASVAEAVRHDLLHEVRHLDDVDPCGHNGADKDASADHSMPHRSWLHYGRIGVRGCWRLRAPSGGWPVDADREGAGGGRSRVSTSTWGCPVEPDGFVGERQGEGDGDVGADDAELAGGDSDAGLAAAVDRVDGRRLGGGADGDAEVDVAQVARRSGELQLVAVVPQRLGGVEELGARGVAAGAAVVVGRYQSASPTNRTHRSLRPRRRPGTRSVPGVPCPGPASSRPAGERVARRR